MAKLFTIFFLIVTFTSSCASNEMKDDMKKTAKTRSALDRINSSEKSVSDSFEDI